MFIWLFFKHNQALREWISALGTATVPIVVLLVGQYLNQQAENRSKAIAKEREKQQKVEMIEQRRQEALKRYLSHMTDLIINKDLVSADHTSPVARVAQVITVTVLRELDTERMNQVTDFLYDADIIQARKEVGSPSLLRDCRLVNANLEGISLIGADLKGSNLTETKLCNAILSQVNLTEAILIRAYLFKTDFNQATLIKASLIGANLTEAILIGANFNQADLSGANLNGAILIGANFNQADLSGANLNGAILTGANFDQAILDRTNFTNAQYDMSTIFPDSFSPKKAGLKLT